MSTGTRTPLTSAEILHERARALAQRIEDATSGQPVAQGAAESSTHIEVLEFCLADERYGAETRYVQEVYPLRELTQLPCTPSFISGVVNVRGHVITVVNLKKFFHLAESGLTDMHRVVLVGEHEAEFGLLADMSVGVRRLALAALQPPLATLSGIGARYVRGITADGLILLDMQAILRDPALVVDDSVELHKETT